MLDNKYIVALVVMQYFACTLANNVTLITPATKKKTRSDLFVNETDAPCGTQDVDPPQRKTGLTNIDLRWQNFNVQLDPEFNSEEQQAIEAGMATLAGVIPCVTFGVLDTYSEPTGDYIYIEKKPENGCKSKIGKIGGRQLMNLKTSCMSHGTIVHEMMHALRVFHEQSRRDRDDYVDIHFENIKPGKERQFNKYKGRAFSTYGVPYNPKSLMHYGKYAFSKNKQPTITSKDGTKVGSKEMQETDKLKLKRMYRC